MSPALRTALEGRFSVREAEAIDPAVAPLWGVDHASVDGAVVQQIRMQQAPVLFLADPRTRRSWGRALSAGHHDVVWTPADPDEVVARLRGLAARWGQWTPVATALCREVAHDLRSPLQAIRFTVSALERDHAFAPGFAEDVGALMEAADAASVQLDAVSQLGRVPDTTGSLTDVELGGVAQAVAARPAFGGRVQVEVRTAARVRARLEDLTAAVQDLLWCATVRSKGRTGRVVVEADGMTAVLSVESEVFEALADHVAALMSRSEPLLLRRKRVPMPLAGLAFARAVAREHGGEVALDAGQQLLRVVLRLPRT